MKRKSTSTDVYYLDKNDLVRRLGIGIPYLGKDELVDVALALNSGQQTLTITVTRNQPETEVSPKPAVRAPDPLVIHEPPLTQKARKDDEARDVAAPDPRPGHLYSCSTYCQHPHPNLGANQPGPPARERLAVRRPVPRDHSLDQDGPGDPI